MRRSRILILMMLALALGAGGLVYWRSVKPGDVSPPHAVGATSRPAPDAAAAPGSPPVAYRADDREEGAQSEAPAPAVVVPQRPYRSSPAQRLHDQQRLLAAEDLPGLAREFEQRAARGDVDAALALRDLVSDCDDARSSADPAGRPLFESLGALGEPHVAWMQFSLAYWEGILPACERLFGEVANWPDQIRAPAIERAAVLGDPGARLQHSHLTNDDSRRNALRELLLEGDPHQWMRYSIWMAPHTLLEDGMVQSTAFFWAGCTRIPACATDPAAYVYDFATPNGSLGARWNQAMSFWDSPRWRAIAQAQALRINELLAVGRIDSLLPPEPMPRRP